MTGKLSYSLSNYWIEVTVQEAGRRFEGFATIFVSLESARSGQGPVHRARSEGATKEEADSAAAAKTEAWADGPGRKS